MSYLRTLVFALLLAAIAVPSALGQYKFQRIEGDIILGQEKEGARFIFHTRPQAAGEHLNITLDNAAGEWQWDSGLILLRNGNVGIGTQVPEHRLSVAGTVKAMELNVTAKDWPDFVFADAYDLRPLKDVAQFIGVHGHLPEMPSAEEIAVTGQNVGAVQAQLLQKIEELTLYMIEMEARVDDLARENEALRARLDANQ